MHATSLLTLALVPALAAQSVTVTLEAVTQSTLQSSIGGQLHTQILPVGPLPATGALHTWQGTPATYAASQVGWESNTGSTEATTTIRWLGGVFAPQPSFADTTNFSVLMTITVPAPITVNVAIERTKALDVGSTVLANRIDIGNDGIFEIQESTNDRLLGPYAVASTLQILVHMDASQLNDGDSLLTNTIRVQPVNDLVIGNPGTLGCLGDQLEVRPSFVGHGIALRSVPFFQPDFAIAVVGTSIQPILLQPALIPCLLLPSTDLLLPLPSLQTMDLPLPPAVRPVGFWVQAVVLSSVGGLQTTNSISVVAY